MQKYIHLKNIQSDLNFVISVNLEIFLSFIQFHTIIERYKSTILEKNCLRNAPQSTQYITIHKNYIQKNLTLQVQKPKKFKSQFIHTQQGETFTTPQKKKITRTMLLNEQGSADDHVISILHLFCKNKKEKKKEASNCARVGLKKFHLNIWLSIPFFFVFLEAYLEMQFFLLAQKETQLFATQSLKYLVHYLRPKPKCEPFFYRMSWNDPENSLARSLYLQTLTGDKSQIM